MLRCMKLWHRARPNRSANPRFMLAVVLTVAAPEDSDATADQPTRVMQFEQGCEHAIEVVQANPRVAFPRAEFVDAEELIYTVALRDGKPDRSGGECSVSETCLSEPNLLPPPSVVFLTVLQADSEILTDWNVCAARAVRRHGTADGRRTGR